MAVGSETLVAALLAKENCQHLNLTTVVINLINHYVVCLDKFPGANDNAKASHM